MIYFNTELLNLITYYKKTGSRMEFQEKMAYSAIFGQKALL
jgi:hypothetical protein